MNDFLGFLPPTVAWTLLHQGDSLSSPMHPEEERILSPTAVPKRRNEFLLGREAAYQSLLKLGIPHPPPVLRGVYREPLWPQEVVGSISHAGSYAISAVTWRASHCSLGVDIEETTKKRKFDVREVIAQNEEQNWINEEPSQISFRTLLLFSAKEAIFKALHPLCHQPLSFHDISLTFQEDPLSLMGKISSKILQILPMNCSLHHNPIVVHWDQTKDREGRSYVATSVLVENA